MTQFEPSAFADGERIPAQYTCEGADASPELTVSELPDEAESLAVVVDDPDAPGGTFTHWLLWHVPADATTIPGAVPQTGTVDALGGARQGENDFGELGYRGPCPPEGDPAHTYRFTLHVLSDDPHVDAGATRETLLDAIADRTIETIRFTGEFGR